MKNLYTLLAFILFTGLISFGQGKVDYDSRSRFYLGFNFGGTYHSNTEVDVNRLYRGGAGFTFGYSFGMKPQKLLSLDLQVRYLLAAYRGISDSKYTLNSNTDDVLNLNEAPLVQVVDYENAYGYYVPNFHSWVNDWSLELKLNTNRWRENTGWNFFVLGGIGTSKYTTRVDFYDNNGAAGQVKPEVDLFEKKVLINDYETLLVRNRDWMPSFGMGIERQITPNASFQLMGRMTWTRNNDFDGLANSFSGQASSENDRYHYASAGVKFYLRGRKNAYIEDDEDPIVQPNPNPPVQGQKPVARFTTPKNTPITVSTADYTLLAIVQNVAGKQNITFTQNGQAISSFLYNANTDKLSYNANLVLGQNTFTVKGVNNYGKAQDQTIIVYKPINTVDPPIVTITNPNTSSVTVNNNTFPFTANVLNVDGKQNVSVFVNGKNYTNFNFNISSKQLSTTLNLVSGKNIIAVTGTNTVGSDTKTVDIIYRKTTTGPPPVVTFLTPSVSPFQTNANSVNVVASISNVSGKNDVSVKINGASTNNFTFGANGKVNLNTGLIQGNNNIEIKGVNQYGQDVETTTIVYKPVLATQPPVVTISTPSNGVNYSVASANIQGTALYVSSKSDVSVYVNGVSTTNFSFNSSSKIVNFNANLVVGNNSIKIVGVNTDGQDQAEVNVIYTRPVVLTPPVVTIIDPAIDNKTYTTASIVAKATVLNVSSKNNISVQVNGNNTNNFSFNSGNKTVTIPLILNSGSNTVNVTGTNNDGTDSKQRIIRYKKAVSINPPTVQFTNPSVSPITVKSPSYTLSAVTTNISSKSQIVLKQNGVVINSGAYTFIGSTISYSATLALGNNNFTVVVSNTAGTDSKSTLITYEKDVLPCTKPTIGYVAPAPNTVVTAAAQNIEAQINNYVVGTVVTLKLNGANLGTMSYNSSTQIANKSVTLTQGVNTFEVTVTNDCGTNKSTFILNYNYTAPCIVPVVKITSSAASTTTNSYKLLASISNVTGSSQVNVKVNGMSKPFNLVSGKLIANVTLQTGNNTIIVTATKACGTDSKSVSIAYNPCQIPRLIMVKPLGTTVTSTSSTYDLSLKVTGDVVQKNIGVKLNGNSIPFSFNTVSKAITVNVVNLTSGVNAVQVLVKNACGNDVVNYKITANLCATPKVVLSSSVSNKVTTVNSLNYAFTGSVTGMTTKTGISVKLNGRSVAFNFQSSTGKVTASMLLKEGANTIVLSALNACGSDSKSLSLIAKTCDVPKLTAVSPRLTTTTTGSSQSFVLTSSGVVSTREITVRLNGAIISKSYSNGKLTFSTGNLKMGVNSVVVTASNNCGSDKVIFSVTRKACNKPTVSLLSTSSKVTKLAFNYSAKVSGASSNQAIVLKLNNKVVSFNYNSKTGLVTSALTLVEGKNTINLTASNKCGPLSKSHIVTATTCKQPEIKVAYPTNTSITTANSTFTILAIGINVVQSDIKVTNNGGSIPFTFNSSTGKITVAVSNMVPGANNIKIKGTNPCGSSEVNYVLTYTGSNKSGTGGGKAPQKRN